jgi:hypothetical protein
MIWVNIGETGTDIAMAIAASQVGQGPKPYRRTMGRGLGLGPRDHDFAKIGRLRQYR